MTKQQRAATEAVRKAKRARHVHKRQLLKKPARGAARRARRIELGITKKVGH
jgi:hypothetical protein